jgi:serine/threonine protein kinase
MQPSRWRAIEKTFLDALGCPEESRLQFIQEACGDDYDLAREIQELLVARQTGSSILNEPAWTFTPEVDEERTVHPGDVLGPYRLGAPLGAGGMGTVFEAEDTRLGRRVAIKILHEEYSDRFQREARAIAALNHPNICTVHDVGPDYLVMELVKGETLKQRISRGKLPLEEVLGFGRQIAEALAAAHARGIVHRDLKPANIMLGENGVKVLDFGLAKAGDSESLTESRAVMGTPAYMAPEQAQGQPAGPAADLFALGLVLYEMTAGRLPLPGTSLGGALASGSNAAVSPLSVPGPFNKLIRQLLDPANRGSAAGAARRLEQLASRDGISRRAVIASCGALAVASGGAAIWWKERSAVPSALIPESVRPLAAISGMKSDLILSPDTNKVAFVLRRDSGSEIHVLAAGEQTSARLTEGAADIRPAWSPDGRQIAFYRMSSDRADGELMVIASDGGAPRSVRPIRLNYYWSGGALGRLVTWTSDGSKLIYSTHDPELGRASLFCTDLQGNANRRLVAAPENVIGLSQPSVSPDGKRLAYAVSYVLLKQKLVVRPFDDADTSGAQEVACSLVGRMTAVSWAPGGESVYFSMNGVLFGWRPRSEPVQVHVGHNIASIGWTARQKLRAIALTLDAGELRMVQLKASGLASTQEYSVLAPATADQRMPEFSPDGRQIAFGSSRSGITELWTTDSSGGNLRQITHLNRILRFPRWSHDSARIAFTLEVTIRPQLFILDLRRPSQPVPVTSEAVGYYAPTWSADERYLYADRAEAGEIYRIPIGGGEPRRLFEGASSKVARDGLTIYYGKLNHPGLFARSLVGDPAENTEQRLVEDYLAPGDDLAIFPEGIYYTSHEKGALVGDFDAIRFYTFARGHSVAVLKFPNAGGRDIVPGITVSRDRRSLIYTALNHRGGDWMVIDFQ